MTQDVRVQEFITSFEALRSEVEKVIVGHREIIDGVLMGMFAGGHVLLEGVPGLGKTLLVSTLAEALELSFSRVQFTPDLMPADILGTNIIVEDAEGRKHFQFQQGPIFAHVLLADEINRATPKTQSALLEGMQEASVTVGGVVATAARALLRAGHAEPHRDGGDLPPARGPARSLHHEAPRPLSRGGGAERHHRSHDPGAADDGPPGHDRARR